MAIGSEKRLRRREVVLGLLGRPPAQGVALLMRVADRSMLREEGNLLARRWLARPGSTIKPFTVLALLEAGKLDTKEGYVCPRRLTIAGRDFTCVHPDVQLAMNASRAIAYSCNCAVAYFARRFAPDELAAALVRNGFTSVRRNLSGDDCRLQALGEDGMRVTPLELLSAYRRLALRAAESKLAPVIEGLEGAVNFGSAQGAQVKDVRVAGKTGSAFPWAWFAGFAPGPKPDVAVLALVEGRSGGADAAPVAGEMLRKFFGS
ncbi:MAG TPA: penicillin-binding transpeptidase domain-containing protein [Bryobacteraceae bacterium]